ncbi:hypothetical protein BDR07DRAFT_1382652 [Suillus spraguei]|nr:hypothetical protein BDR07DRAFT_1382652 [Suillus spraguei]
MSNRRSSADVDQTHSANPSSGLREQLQDNQHHSQGHSLSSSSSTSFHQSTPAPPPTGHHQWFQNSQQMIVANSSFYDPTQASGFTAHQPTMNVWDTNSQVQVNNTLPPSSLIALKEHRPASIHFLQTNFNNNAPLCPLHGARVVVVPGTIGKVTRKPSNIHKSLLPFPQILRQPKFSLLNHLKSQQAKLSLHNAEHQYSAQQSQPHFSPPPTQSQFQIQQTQFPTTHQFPQSQAQARPQSSRPSESTPTVSTLLGAAGFVLPSERYVLFEYTGESDTRRQSTASLHSTHAPTSTPHAHSISPHSPFASFGPHTPPTPSGDAGAGGPLLGLPRSHDSVSPASYASHPTSSSFDDSSSGHPASSGMGHAATSSISTVTPGSPPIAAAPQPQQQQQQQQQRVQIRQRPIMPITAATTTAAQAGPAQPSVVPKPPAPRPATNRRARAPKRPRPSTSQGGGGGGGDSDDDSDDDDVVEWSGPSMPSQGAATGMPGQRK